MNKNKKVNEEGTIEFFHPKTKRLHNENGPAVIAKCSFQCYYIDGQRHRIDGPARYGTNGNYSFEQYFICGMILTKQEFELFQVWFRS